LYYGCADSLVGVAVYDPATAARQTPDKEKGRPGRS